ncbi:MAG: 30S ribosomal protein S18 [Candidatus Bipolaricaulia bacterium]
MVRRRRCRACERDYRFSYKDPGTLKHYMNRLGRILPKRTTHLCAKHQREVARVIKRARKVALLPYVGE